MTEPAIEVVDLSKRYRLAERSLISRIIPSRRRADRELWANQNLNLRIEKGETVGMLGRNGAGKSTLLRMLAGVSEPTSGSLTVNGRIAPLISVGVGFHQELTGRENVYVNGMLLGLTRSEIDERFDQIVDFAELGDRIDSPVKFYSSGMFMRLGFSVAIHVDPEVLLVDEVLAVGDLAFQVKCFDRMRDLVAGGTTILLVSHSTMAIQLLCPRTLVFSKGRLCYDGPTPGAIEEHHRLLAETGDHTAMAVGDQAPTGDVSVEARLMHHGTDATFADQDTDLRLVADVAFHTDVEDPQVVFRVVTDNGDLAYQHHTSVGESVGRRRAGSTSQVTVDFRPAFGGGGTFNVELTVADSTGKRALGRSRPSMLYVPPRWGDMGLGDLRARAQIDGHELHHRPLTLGEGRPTPE